MNSYWQRVEVALAHARETANLGQKAVAERAGTTQQVISGIITRKSRGSEYTAQIAYACGVDAYWLATGKGQILPRSAGDLTADAMQVARGWMKLPEFKQAGYMQAIITDAAVLEVFPEIREAMRLAAVATSPDYHRATEMFIQSREKLKRQFELDFSK